MENSIVSGRFCELKSFVDRGLNLGNAEGLAADLVDGPCIDQELVAQDGLQLSAVHLGDEDMLVALL